MRPVVVAAAALSLGAYGLVATPPATAVPTPTTGFEDVPSPAYGSVSVGTSSRLTFTLSNVGGSSTAVVRTALTGSAAFSISPGDDQCSGHALGPRKTCTIAVTYAPAAVGAHDVATLTAASRKGTSASITLTGDGGEGSCTDGAMRVSGTIADGFDTCDHGVWVARACAPGTHAVEVSPGVVVCDY